MGNVVDFDPDAMKPHRISQVICLRCLYRWTCVRPKETRLVDLVCPVCRMDGGVIETGEIVIREGESV